MIDLVVKSLQEHKDYVRDKSFIITYGFHDSKLGKCLLGITDKYICYFSFVTSGDNKHLSDMQGTWPGAEFIRDEKKTGTYMSDIFEDKENTLYVIAIGTPFLEAVWRETLKIKKGDVTTYKNLAEKIGKPKAVRAVGTALGRNPVAYIIPCHRVIGSGNNNVLKYGGGADMKRKLLDSENVQLAIKKKKTQDSKQ